MNDLVIEVDRVGKRFGKVTALDNVSVTVPRGTVLGLLGHNGAGKTTLVNILSTLQPPDSGTARVAGYDVVRQRHQVCTRIGLTGQFAAVDEQLSGLDNLILVARLLGATRRAARVRAEELLTVFDLADAAKRVARTYSGGMRRRLDLAASMVGRPEVIFLDEPTTGLDPVSRTNTWELVETMVMNGTTVLLTTQYLEEADRLADSIAVLSAGQVIASGTATELKAQAGRRTVAVTLTNPADVEAALRSLTATGLHPAFHDDRFAIVIPVTASRELAVVVRALDEAGIEPTDVSLGEPTLDDVYLDLAKNSAAAPRGDLL